MLTEGTYDRAAAVEYARRWALSRNPGFFDFEDLGGDCTNFASQCILAGAGVMNWTPVTGWYYVTADRRTASWTGVEFLYDFLVGNGGPGPWAREVPPEQAEPGDIIQLGSAAGRFYHSPVIVAVRPRVLVCAHTYDALDRELSSYVYARARFIHIEGVRREAQ